MTDDRHSEEERRELWENVLTTRTEAAFREFVFDRLHLRPGDSVLSVGCGPGYETALLAERIGEDGDVTGVDVNGAVLAAARDRCRPFPQVSFQRGDATDLPMADESYDLAVAKQVLSEISDVGSALDELFRVVKPGGRAAVTAGDARMHVKHTPTELMRRADEIYRSERGDRRLGTRLVSLLPEAGFAVEDVVPRAKVQTEIDDQVERGIDVQRRFLESSESFDEAEIEAWEDDLRDLDERHRFLSCGTSFLYVARKPE